MTAAPPASRFLVPPAWPDWWSAPPTPSPRRTAAGLCLFRAVPINLPDEARFRIWWKTYGGAMTRAGWGLNSWNDKTTLQQWLTIDGCLTPVTLEKIARLDARRAEQATGTLNLPEPELVLDPLPHDLEGKLRGYQVIPARQLFRSLTHGKQEWGYPGAVDFSDMGTGKTYMGLAAALATGRKVVVLCPVVGRAGWERAFQHFDAEPHFIGTYEGLRSGNRPHVVAQREDGTFVWQSPDDIILILDEAQALRHDDTLNVALCSGAVRQGIPIIAASATIAIDPREFRFAGRIVGLHDGAEDWNRFLVRHGCSKPKGSKTWKWDGDFSALARINAALFPRRGCRVRKQDLGEECPETSITVLPIRCAAGERIAKLWNDTEAHLARLRGTRQYEIEWRRCRMRIWQAAEKALVEPIAECCRVRELHGNPHGIGQDAQHQRWLLRWPAARPPPVLRAAVPVEPGIPAHQSDRSRRGQRQPPRHNRRPTPQRLHFPKRQPSPHEAGDWPGGPGGRRDRVRAVDSLRAGDDLREDG